MPRAVSGMGLYRSQKGVWVVDACTQLSLCSESNTNKIIDSEMEAGLCEVLGGLHCRSLSITNSSPSQSLQTHRIIYPEPLYLSHLDPCGCLHGSLRCRGWVAVVPSWSSFGHIKSRISGSAFFSKHRGCSEQETEETRGEPKVSDMMRSR